MRFMTLFPALLAPILLLACAPEPPSAPGPAAEDHASEQHAGHDHGAHQHGEDPSAHGHGAAHGGQQQEVNGMHVEALFQADGVRFYVTDGDNRPIQPDRVLGSARVTGPSGVTNVSLMAMGEALHAPVALTTGQPASAVLTFTLNGGSRSALFETRAVGTAFHDHTSLHGGQVGMWGHYHVELRAAEGRYRVWVTDAARGPVSAVVTGAIRDGEQSLPLELDAPSGALQATAEGAGARPVTVELSIDGQPLALPFQPIAASP